MRPSLLLDFANTRRLDPRITFTRASTGTYFDRFGVLKTAAVNEPRFDFDPVTGYCKGLLIEEARTNLLTYSEQFDNAAWVKTNASITANAITAPDGTLAADKLIEDSTSNAHYVGSSCSFTSGTAYAFSVYAKAGERSVLQISFPGTAFSNAYANFDLSAGVVSASSGVSASITPVGGGAYRCTAVATATASTSSNAGLVIQTSPAAARLAIYQGDGASGLYVWGAQIEVGSFATSYIPTTSAAVTRGAEVASITGGNFSPWFNAAEGTLLVAVDRPALNATRSSHLVSMSDGTTSNGIILHADSAALRSFSVDAGGVSSCSLVSGTETAGQVWRAAAAYRANDFALSAGGAATVADSSGALPSINQLWLGNRFDSARAYNGHLASVAYYPRRLSNAELVELTR